MNESILVEAGLTEAQAKAYALLAKNSPISPPALSLLANETRTNMYKVLEQLEELDLAQKDESEKKIKYWAKNPSSLLQYVTEKKEAAELQTKKLQSSLPSLVNDFLKHNEQPGVKFFQGKEGIKEIYNDQITSGSDVLFVRSPCDVELYSYDEMRKLRGSFAKAKVKRHVFSPDAADVPIDWRKVDPIRNLERTWMKSSDYTAAVEWGVYADKVSILSFGQEAIGMVIESKQIADSMRQLLSLVDEGLKSRPDYDQLPLNAKVLITESFEIGKGKHAILD